MKKKTLRVAMIALSFACVAFTTSCTKLDFDFKCPDDNPYYCKDRGSCCAYEWTDNHGSCYNTLDYCRQTGWNCSHCYIQD
jgi:hypothetical protein